MPDDLTTNTNLDTAIPFPDDESIDWRKAFFLLVLCTCTGFVSSNQVQKWAQVLHDEVDPRVAQYLMLIFNNTRSSWMQGFMG